MYAGNEQEIGKWWSVDGTCIHEYYLKQNVNLFYGDVFCPRHFSKSSYLTCAPESVESLAGIERTINNIIFHDMENKVRFTPERAVKMVQKFPFLYGIQHFIAMITESLVCEINAVHHNFVHSFKIKNFYLVTYN